MVHPDAANLRNREDVYQWYTTEIASIPPVMRELLEKYSGIPHDDVIPHISKLRDRAFDTWPYPCIGQLRFLNLNLSTSPLYPTVLSRLTTQSQTFLDAGCCFGQDLRKLAFDGAPPASLYGLDLEPAFLELGYDLFCDRAKMVDATFVSGSLLDSAARFPELEGSIDMVLANSLLHLFTWAEQIVVASRLVGFLKPQPGSMIMGRHVGAVEAGEYRALSEGATSFRHNVQSFRRLWDEVGQETDSRWKVDAQLDLKDIVPGVNLGQKWTERGTRRMHFTVTRE
ncbi:MAG: hypothetical protein MMC33_005496 [Icmadophila ericetorum]|nr:hypothetical protein [Icmadophila ericetorum]